MPCLVVGAPLPGLQLKANTWYSSNDGRGDPSWKPSPLPSEHDSPGGVRILPERVLVYGGVAKSGTANPSCEVYDILLNVWTVRAPAPSARLYPQGALLTDGVAAFMGGQKVGTTDYSLNEVYDYASNTWSTRASVPTPRSLAAGTRYGEGKGSLIGGQAGGSLTGLHEVYDYATNTWSTRAAMPTPRNNYALIHVDEKLAAIGGNASSGYTGANEVYDPATDSWATKASTVARNGLRGDRVRPNQLIVVGGLSTSNPLLDRADLYDLPSNTWQTLPSAPTKKRYHAAVSPVEGVLVCAGGFTELSSGSAENEVYSM